MIQRDTNRTDSIFICMSCWAKATAPLHSSGAIFAQLKQLLANMEILYKLLKTERSTGDPSGGIDLKGSGDIVFKNVYYGSIIRDTSFHIRKGHEAAFVGRSGAGKSTIFNLLMRDYGVSGGVITINREDIRNISFKCLRETIVYVTQEPRLFNSSLKDNFLSAKEDATMDEIIWACQTACIHDDIKELRDGYGTNVGPAGSRLSGGQKKRVAIAMALIRNPKILLLDEATSALDSDTELRVRNRIRNTFQDITVLTITHQLATIEGSDIIF